MESTFPNTSWKQRKEENINMRDTEHHSTVLSTQQLQEQQMIKVLCLPSQEIISHPNLPLPLTNSQRKLSRPHLCCPFPSCASM